MTDFAGLLIADDGGPATALTLVAPGDSGAGLDEWLLGQSERVRVEESDEADLFGMPV